MKTLFYLVLLVVAVGVLWIRYSPISRDEFHVDPADVDPPGSRGHRLIGREAPRYPADPDTVLATFRSIALDEPRTKELEGDLDEGMMTFVTRTKTLGFPDLITVKAVSEGAVTKLSVVSRARFPGSDWGTNARRLDRWLQEMRLRPGE
jgi:uncharacterized protein (DUF1499 family)